MIGFISRASQVAILAGATCKADSLRTIVRAAAAFLCATAYLAIPAAADVIETGDAVIAGFSGTKAADDVPTEGDPFDEDFIDLDGTSMQIRRLDPDAPPAGQLIDAPNVFSAKAGEVGQVFAIGLDDSDCASRHRWRWEA